MRIWLTKLKEANFSKGYGGICWSPYVGPRAGRMWKQISVLWWRFPSRHKKSPAVCRASVYQALGLKLPLGLWWRG